MTLKKKALDDTWTYQTVGTPFPKDAVKVKGQNNIYIALWYRHGKPVMGPAWNDGGIVQCEFAADNKVFAGEDALGPLGGVTIQLLTYEGTHVTKKFFYDWKELTAWKKLKDDDTVSAVHCGTSAVVFWKTNNKLGNYDMSKNVACFSVAGKYVEVSDQETLNSMQILVRNTDGGPPHCPCDMCTVVSKAKPATTRKLLMVNDWGDFCCGDPWPEDKPIIRALNRSMNTPTGSQDHFVALWYLHGKPSMGRAWKHAGKVDASFVAYSGSHSVTGLAVGSLQLLVELPAASAGFDYIWLPYEQASRYHEKDFAPVHINFVAPCVIQIENKYEVLGSVNLKKETVEAVVNGNIVIMEGPKIKSFQVLCRRDRDDTMLI